MRPEIGPRSAEKNVEVALRFRNAKDLAVAGKKERKATSVGRYFRNLLKPLLFQTAGIEAKLFATLHHIESAFILFFQSIWISR